jgi:hypothetical protein
VVFRETAEISLTASCNNEFTTVPLYNGTRFCSLPLLTRSLRRCDCKGRVKPGMAAGCLFLLLVLYTEKAVSAVTRKPSDPVRLCAFLPYVLCVGMFIPISSLCTLRENVNFFPVCSAWECSFLPYELCVGNVHFFPV